MAYKFKATTTRRQPATVTRPEPAREPEEIPGSIHGVQAGSKEEWRFYKSLIKYDIAFQYQVAIDGGRNVPGGQVVDFVLYIPYTQPVFIHGVYWHKDTDENRFKFDRATQEFGREPDIVWDYEIPDQGACDSLVKARYVH